MSSVSQVIADNKVDLAKFLSDELCSHVRKEKEIVAAGGFMEEFEVRSSKGPTDVNALRSTHEKADTWLVLHAVHRQFKTVVSFSDMDVFLLLVAHFPLAQCEHIWTMSGTSKKRRYIPIMMPFSTFNNEIRIRHCDHFTH